MTTEMAAKRLGVNASRVRQFIRDGRLKATKMGRDNIIHENDVEAFIRDLAEMRPGPRARAVQPNQAGADASSEDGS